MSGRVAISLTVLFAFLGAGLSACGDSGEADRPEDRASIEALVGKLNDAIRTRDPAEWCSIFTPSSIEGTFGSLGRCQQETATVLKSGGRPATVAVSDIAFVDDTARVSFQGRAGDANVVLENGEWYFSLDQQVDPGTSGGGDGGDESGG